MSSQPPNILLITTDQQRHDHLGVAGMPGIATPHLDRLATEGVRFTRAYCPSPICTPSRVSLLTGQYPSRHGAYAIGVTPEPFPRPTLPEQLKAAGYATALLGKAHFVRIADHAPHMIGEASITSDTFRTWHGPYLGFDHVETSIGHTINQAPNMHYRVFLDDAGVDYLPWYPHAGGAHDHYTVGAWNIPVEFHDTTWVTNNTVRWIEQQAGGDASGGGAPGSDVSGDDASGRPWFAWASYQDPHEPFVCPEPWYSAVDADGLEPFEGIRDGEFDDKPAFYAEAARGDWVRYNDGCGVPCVYHAPRWDAEPIKALRATLGMVGMLDAAVGRLIKTLECTGQLDNTIILYTSDHGEMHGHHGFWGKGLTAYDDCQRVPLLAFGPGHVAARGAVDAPVSLVDLPRTILGYAGLTPAQGTQGHDLRPVLAGDADRAADATLVECMPTPRVFQQTMVTHDGYKLVLYRDGEPGELYDLNADPDQYVNLYDDLARRPLRGDLLERFATLTLKNHGQVRPRGAFS